ARPIMCECRTEISAGPLCPGIVGQMNTPRKLLCIEKLKALGWRPSISLEDGLAETYRWYCSNPLGA
ncbi:MAG: hypothetical protein M3N93_03115, partial [Acidobacteriota bacterium]|nr:hypothetical protein [Acidobacteriota bacterium]